MGLGAPPQAQPEFSVQSDVFDTLKELLLKHKGVTSELLADKYDRIIGEYTKLLTSEAYMTKKLGLGLLGKLLLPSLCGTPPFQWGRCARLPARQAARASAAQRAPGGGAGRHGHRLRRRRRCRRWRAARACRSR